jgi:hypothetical protein
MTTPRPWPDPADIARLASAWLQLPTDEILDKSRVLSERCFYQARANGHDTDAALAISSKVMRALIDEIERQVAARLAQEEARH